MIVDKQTESGWGNAVVERLSIDLKKEFPVTGGGRQLDYWFAVVFCWEDKHLGKSMGHSSVYKFISSGRKPTGTAIEK